MSTVMTLDHETPAGPELRCRACGARNAPGAVWCSLCFRAMAEAADAVELPAAADRSEDDRREDHDRREGGADVDALLAELAVREAPPSRFGGLSNALSSPGARVAVMLGGTAVVSGGAFGLMAAAGSLL